ncbi:MAG: DUF998 domain-containing protein [Actinobacteria bacterium]|nr:DUF998 domain-containing protein [Actinomycetota bacterium]
MTARLWQTRAGTARRSVASSLAAPVCLIGGWFLAAAVQPGGFDSVTDTISALAGTDTPSRWIMTTAFIATGVAHIVTASGLGTAPKSARIGLAIGGASLIAVAAFPVSATATPVAHSAAALVGFASLACWASLGRWSQQPAEARWVTRPVVRHGVTIGLSTLTALFLLQVITGGDQIGLTERLAAGAEALWPLAISLGTYSVATPAPRRR